MMLKIMGHDARTAYDGDEAVIAAEEFRPDAAVLDLGLPKRGGYDVCRLLRLQPWGRDLLIIAQTGWGADENRRRTQDAGFDHHLVKPVDPQALMALTADRSAAGLSNP